MSWFDDLLSSKTGQGLLNLGVSAATEYFGGNDPKVDQAGYQGGIPEYEVQRERVPNIYDPNRRPGSAGRRYFTDTQFIPKAAGPALPDATGLASINAQNVALANAMPGVTAPVAPPVAPAPVAPAPVAPAPVAPAPTGLPSVAPAPAPVAPAPTGLPSVAPQPVPKFVPPAPVIPPTVAPQPARPAPTSPITSQSPGISQLIGERPANATDQDWERYTNAVIEQHQKRLDGDAGRYVGVGEGPNKFQHFMSNAGGRPVPVIPPTVAPQRPPPPPPGEEMVGHFAVGYHRRPKAGGGYEYYKTSGSADPLPPGGGWESSGSPFPGMMPPEERFSFEDIPERPTEPFPGITQGPENLEWNRRHRLYLQEQRLAQLLPGFPALGLLPPGLPDTGGGPPPDRDYLDDSPRIPVGNVPLLRRTEPTPRPARGSEYWDSYYNAPDFGYARLPSSELTPERISEFYNLGYAGNPFEYEGRKLWNQDYPGAMRLAVMPQEGRRYAYGAEGGQYQVPIGPLAPYAGKTASPQVPGGSLEKLRQAAASGNIPMGLFAEGGIANLNKGMYLGGATDGMADVIPANIEGTQEARLSDGEFVMPADVVSHLGNGNSNAGAKTLYTMMDRIRKARTGTKSQGKEINPNKFLPV